MSCKQNYLKKAKEKDKKKEECVEVKEEVMEEHKDHIKVVGHQKMKKNDSFFTAMDMEEEEATLEKETSCRWNVIIATSIAILPGNVVV